jgi:hypothetical protein
MRHNNKKTGRINMKAIVDAAELSAAVKALARTTMRDAGCSYADLNEFRVEGDSVSLSSLTGFAGVVYYLKNVNDNEFELEDGSFSILPKDLLSRCGSVGNVKIEYRSDGEDESGCLTCESVSLDRRSAVMIETNPGFSLNVRKLIEDAYRPPDASMVIVNPEYLANVLKAFGKAPVRLWAHNQVSLSGRPLPMVSIEKKDDPRDKAVLMGIVENQKGSPTLKSVDEEQEDGHESDN